MKTFGALKTEIRNQIFASGEPENLISAHNDHFQEGAAEIAKWVECEQEDNVNLIPFCETRFKCGMTVIPAPAGVVHRVFTVANSEYCDPVFYWQREWPAPECWSRNLLTYTKPLNVGYPKMPLGFQYPESSTDSICGRARTGIWSIHKGNIYIAPWIQSNELIVVEWSGIKTTWADGDLVNEAQDYRKALKMFMQYAHERDYGNMERAREFLSRRPGAMDGGWFADALADLMWQCREQIKLRGSEQCPEERERYLDEITDDAVPEVDESGTVIAHIGNFGDGNQYTDLVAALVDIWTPSDIVTSGNNSAHSEYDRTVGRLFHSYVGAYPGAYGDGASSNHFWPVPGAHDWLMGAVQKYFDYFDLPGNERYYDVEIGPVHFFILNSDPREPGGTSSTSPQAVWLQAALAASTSVWNVVAFHHVPYSSDIVYTPGVTGMRWPFAAWGADAVICGHAHSYERLEVDGIPYIVSGNGGKSLRAFGALLPESQMTLEDYGALRIIANGTGIRFEEWTVTGTGGGPDVMDSVELGYSYAAGATEIAVIGDYGGDTADEAAVAAIIAGWDITAIVTVGDNYYPASPALAIDDAIGQYYADYIGSYTGAYGAGAAANAFYPAIGNHDFDGKENSAAAIPYSLSPYSDFFTSLPNNGRYYDTCIGLCHFFFISSNSSEPDGNEQDSAQALWLQAKMTLSTAPWKIVVLHDSPYSSTTPNTNLIWTYKSWGADMVLSGGAKNYERFDKDGLVYINNGLGGNGDVEPIVTVADDSEFHYSAGFGAGKITAAAASLKYEFIDTAGTVIDSVTLTK